MRSNIYTGLLLFLFLAPARPQPAIAGPQILTFLSDVDDSDQPYAIYVPPDLDKAKKYPLVVSLHGAFSNHRINLRRVFGKGNRAEDTDLEASRRFPPFPPEQFLVVSPLARGTMGYEGIAEKDVYDVLRDVKRRFPVDEDRIYLTGLSMGGGGALRLGLTRPDVWAAIAPVCPAVPEGIEELAGNALNLPVHLFQGSLDPLVPARVSRSWQKRLLDLGVQVEYIEYPNVRHNAWDSAYAGGRIFDWFSKFKKNRYPERVRFTTLHYKYFGAYWVHLNRLTPGTPAAIDAKFIGKDRIEITTKHLDGFTLELSGHPMYTGRRMLRLTIDGTAVSTRSRAGTFSFRKVNDKWLTGKAQIPTREKRPGVEGPLPEVVAARHVYVYGTADNPGETEIKRRREVAAKAAEWSAPLTPLLLSFHVVSDRELSAEDRKEANLILFGTRETNSLIAALPQVPMALNPGAADYGVIYAAPLGDRNVLVDSGLPWWTGADQVQRATLPYVQAPYQPVRVLQTFGDFVVFRGSLEDVVSEGMLRRDWKLPAEAAAKIKATGAVQIP